MDNVTHLGLDVHKETIAVAIRRPGEVVPDERVIPNTPDALRKLVRHSPRQLATCYEAGPTGYDTHRLLTSLGVPCDVIAPTLTPRRAGQRVKTHRLDARMLARSTAPASSHRSACPPRKRKRSGISSESARISRTIASARGSGCGASCCAMVVGTRAAAAGR